MEYDRLRTFFLKVVCFELSCEIIVPHLAVFSAASDAVGRSSMTSSINSSERGSENHSSGFSLMLSFTGNECGKLKQHFKSLKGQN